MLPVWVRTSVLSIAKAEFTLGRHSPHGPAHWARVRANGLKLAHAGGGEANESVIELFAMLHDCRRRSDDADEGHGDRAAALAIVLCYRKSGAFSGLLSKGQLTDLVAALAHHSAGITTPASVTVATCWDADRLDLGRVGITPDPARLCTVAARDPVMIEWAYRRSIK